ncbi:hypothetical protein D1224_14680 [Henriciella barbarensis]|uniref:Pentapeptide repeat-containing protein n=1 Tax=Henriciella barbarensis TaxID=86342 RepID=A0A399QS19_9PROT|nr:pentapeptide repeat-containing protein [Henriciella barbarensis]RIJ20369.1 hypothetical protein D1224_14680 [Henriciella barbarensis]
MAGGVDGISQEWWDRWWKEDWSWEGLAKKPWEGWVVPKPGAEPVPDEEYDRRTGHPDAITRFGPEARKATLQDYWRDQADHLINWSDAEGHTYLFTRLHLPLHWPDGSRTPKLDWSSDALNHLIETRLNQVNERAFEETHRSEVDWRAQFQGVIFADFSIDRFTPRLLPEAEEGKQLAVSFRSCCFTGYTRFAFSTFARDVEFRDAAFANDTGFYETSFNGGAIFEQASFSKDALFKMSTFHQITSFHQTTFNGYTSFEEALFSGSVSFDGVSFRGKSLFGQTRFASGANFANAVFTRGSDFRDANFAGDARFTGAIFLENVSFIDAKFDGDARFNGSNFAGQANFSCATFAGSSRFHNVFFAGYALFPGAVFAGTAWFDETAFAASAIFSKASFAIFASFDKTVFADRAVFTGKGASVATDSIAGTLTSDSDFGRLNLDIPQHATWVAQRSFPDASFACTLFLGDANFANRDFHSQTSFENSVFLRPAAFHDSKLHRGITFRNTWFQDGLTRDKMVKVVPTKYKRTWNEGLNRLFNAENSARRAKGENEIEYGTWLEVFNEKRQADEDEFCKLKSEGDVGKSERAKYFGKLEDCYRTLKHLMEDRRDRHEEGRFHKLELRARRKRRRPAINISEQWLSHLYGWSADYGNSVLLPIGWLLVGSFVLAGVYTLMGTTGPAHFGHDLFAPYSAVDWGETLSYSFSRVFPFGGWGDPDQCSMIGQMLAADGVGLEAPCGQVEGRVDRDFVGGTPLALKALTTFQSISAIILIFLAGLAARRKFQIN